VNVLPCGYAVAALARQLGHDVQVQQSVDALCRCRKGHPRAARRIARQRDVPLTGTVGILGLCVRRGRVPPVKPPLTATLAYAAEK